jgi:3-oxoacyl-ACP reductase-like protein
MRALSLITFLGAAALSVSAIAAPSVTPDASSSALTSITVPGGANRTLREQEITDVQGTYHLSDGRVMHVTSEARRLYADINGGSKAQLVKAGDTTFVSREDGTRFEFDQLPFATNVTMTRK